MTVEAARQCAKDRKEWRALVHMLMIVFNECGHFCVLSDPLGGLSSGQGWDAFTTRC